MDLGNILLPFIQIAKKNFRLSVEFTMSSSEETTVYEESEISTEDLEFAQKPEENMSEEEILEEPVRAESPVMWQRRRMSTVAEQVAIQPIEILEPAPTHEQIIDAHLGIGQLPRHRVPTELLNVRTERWVGTHNREEFVHVTERLKQACEDLGVQFMDVFREEAPKTGHVHYHSVVVFFKKVTAHSVIAIDPYAHWQKMGGQLISAWDYAAKNGDRAFQYGTAPMTLQNHWRATEQRQQRKTGPTKTQLKWNELVRRAKAGDETIRDEQLYAKNMAYFDRILNGVHVHIILDCDLSSKNIWIWGPPGTGKSRLVRRYAQENKISLYNKLQNKWWDGFENQQIVLIEDADPQTMKLLTQHMKCWSDRYSFSAEVKGSSRVIDPYFHLVVTSNYPIEECFVGVDASAIIRRFDVLEMN